MNINEDGKKRIVEGGYMFTKTHEHIYVYMRSRHIRRDTIFTEFRG